MLLSCSSRLPLTNKIRDRAQDFRWLSFDKIDDGLVLFLGLNHPVPMLLL